MNGWFFSRIGSKSPTLKRIEALPTEKKIAEITANNARLHAGPLNLKPELLNELQLHLFSPHPLKTAHRIQRSLAGPD